MAKENHIGLVYSNANLKSYAEELSKRFDIPFASEKNVTWLLSLDELGLTLNANHDASSQGLQIIFDAGKNDYRRRNSNGRKQPLSRAVGLDKPRALTIYDVTAGFGRDGFMLACLGANITFLERQPVMAALLYDGLKRASLNKEIDEAINNIELVHADSIQYLEPLADNSSTKKEYPDVIYMDPMYPTRKKSALVKKDMQYAHELIGLDDDAKHLLEIARTVAKKRVVVKRPKGAEFLGGLTPSTSITAKTTRYDIYANAKLD